MNLQQANLEEPLMPPTVIKGTNERDKVPKYLLSWWRGSAYVLFSIALNLACIVAAATYFVRQFTHLATGGILVVQYMLLLVCILDIVAKIRALGFAKGRVTLNHDIADVLLVLLDAIVLFTQSKSKYLFVFRMLRVAQFTRVFTVYDWFMTKRIERKVPNLVFDVDGRIERYNASKLFSSGFLTNLTGSVFAAPELWIQFILLSFVATMYAFNMCDVNCSHAFVSSLTSEGHKKCPTYCVAYIGENNGFILSGLVSFLLGFFNNNTYTRWWTVRDKLGMVIGRTINLAVVISTYLPGQSPEAEKARRLFMRYINLAHGFVYKQAMESKDYDSLLEKGLATEEELKLVDGLPSKYAVAYMWAAQVLTSADRAGLVPHGVTVVPMVQTDISAMRGAAADIFMYTDCQVPYSYSHLVTWMTKLHLLLVAICGGSFIGAGFQRGFFSDYVWGYLIIFINSAIYNGLLHVHHVLHNPLTGDGSSDFPQEWYLRYCMTCGSHILDQVSRLPFKEGIFGPGKTLQLNEEEKKQLTESLE